MEEVTEIALKTVTDWQKCNPGYGRQVLFACFHEETTQCYRRIWAEKEAIWNQRPVVWENNGTVEKALHFAANAHRGGVLSFREDEYTPVAEHINAEKARYQKKVVINL